MHFAMSFVMSLDSKFNYMPNTQAMSRDEQTVSSGPVFYFVKRR